jgi:hypothetical protein
VVIFADMFPDVRNTFADQQLASELLNLLNTEGRFFGNTWRLLFCDYDIALDFDVKWIAHIMSGSPMMGNNKGPNRSEELWSVCSSIYGVKEITPREYAEACLIVLKMSI